MPTFSYRALQADGKIAEGVLEAAGRPDALRQMETLGLRPVNLAEKAGGGAKNGSAVARHSRVGKYFLQVRVQKSFRQGTGKFHAAAFQPARGGRAVEPRAGDFAQGSLVAGGAGEVEGSPRPRGGRHVAGGRDGEIAGNVSARLCRDGRGGRGGRLSGRGAGADRGISDRAKRS